MRAALKKATSHLHEKVDAAMPLSRPSPTLQDYCNHLQILADWVRDLGGLGVDPSRLRAEAGAIDVDLRECARLLGVDAPAATEYAGTATSTTTPYAWGARYVLEGSRLGGKVLYRQLAQPLAPHALAYLSGEGWVREGAWRDFLESLRHHLRSDADIAAACEGAKAAFTVLLDRCSEPQAALT